MSRVGQFLIARPTVELGFFRRSVVFIYEDSLNGVAGLALTTPTTLNLRDLALQRGIDYPKGVNSIYHGGPMAPNAVMMLHTDDFVSSNTLHTGSGFDVSSDNVMIEKIISGNEPNKFKLVAGCSAWAYGQLDQEISRGYWLIAKKLKPEVVFDLYGERQWTAAIDQVSKDLVAQYF